MAFNLERLRRQRMKTAKARETARLATSKPTWDTHQRTMASVKRAQLFAAANGSSDPADFFGEDWKRYCYPLHALANHLRENFPNDRDALVMAKEFEQFAAVDPDAWSPVDYWIEHASADLRRAARV